MTLQSLVYVKSKSSLFYLQEEHSGNFGQYEEGNEMFFNEFSRLDQHAMMIRHRNQLNHNLLLTKTNTQFVRDVVK